jgi:homoserine dehydrogenase
MISARREVLAQDHDLTFRVTAIATGTRGCILAPDINLEDALERVAQSAPLSSLDGVQNAPDPLTLIKQADADVLFETSPLNPADGEPASSHVRLALSRGLHVVTANKGPVAFAYRALRSLAAENAVQFRFEGAVMDGAPIFNMVRSCLPAVKVLGFSGALNSTTNIILSSMESGRSFGESLAEAQRLGVAEANADHDIDGWDSAVKAVALANVLMDADLRPSEVIRTGIRQVMAPDLLRARESGNILRLIARGERSRTGVRLTVRPETVRLGTPLATATGANNILTLKTDLMGELSITETAPGVEQTAYALLSDWISIYGARDSRV